MNLMKCMKPDDFERYLDYIQHLEKLTVEAAWISIVGTLLGIALGCFVTWLNMRDI